MLMTGLRNTAHLKVSGYWPIRWPVRKPPWLPPMTAIFELSTELCWKEMMMMMMNVRKEKTIDGFDQTSLMASSKQLMQS